MLASAILQNPTHHRSPNVCFERFQSTVSCRRWLIGKVSYALVHYGCWLSILEQSHLSQSSCPCMILTLMYAVLRLNAYKNDLRTYQSSQSSPVCRIPIDGYARKLSQHWPAWVRKRHYQIC